MITLAKHPRWRVGLLLALAASVAKVSDPVAESPPSRPREPTAMSKTVSPAALTGPSTAQFPAGPSAEPRCSRVSWRRQGNIACRKSVPEQIAWISPTWTTLWTD